MKFVKQPPTKWGYYWIVNKSHPVPLVGFYYKNNGMHHIDICGTGTEEFSYEHSQYRFGDQIVGPKCEDNNVEN